MNTQKATYWFALALFAMALRSEYRSGAFPAFHRAANRADATLCRLSANAERTLAMARLPPKLPKSSTDARLAGRDVRPQLRKIRVLSKSRVIIVNAVDRPVISIAPTHCAQSALRVEAPSVDLRMDNLRVDGSPDDDADSQ